MRIFTEELTHSKHKVISVVYAVDSLSAQALSNSYEVDEIPTPFEHHGKDGILYYNPFTNELYYEYVDRPLTEMEILQNKLNEQEQQIQEQQLALLDLGNFLAEVLA